MRLKLLIPLAGAIALTAVCFRRRDCPAAQRPAQPAIEAKQAQAARVLKEIASIDESLNTISEQFDGARVRLQALRKNLTIERGRSRRRERVRGGAEARREAPCLALHVEQLVALDVILGARASPEMLRLSDAESAITKQAAVITRQTRAGKDRSSRSACRPSTATAPPPTPP